jgi:hypothetical protein
MTAIPPRLVPSSLTACDCSARVEHAAGPAGQPALEQLLEPVEPDRGARGEAVCDEAPQLRSGGGADVADQVGDRGDLGERRAVARQQRGPRRRAVNPAQPLAGKQARELGGSVPADHRRAAARRDRQVESLVERAEIARAHAHRHRHASVELS